MNNDTPPSSSPADLRKPCSECPFSRRTAPGALGGSIPTVYIGQAFAGMWLPCHMLYDPMKSAKDQDANRCGQCAGAAIFRANCGIETPPGIKRLPPDTEAVFASPAEFLAHHAALPLAVAKMVLLRYPPQALAAFELNKATVRVQAVRR